MDFVVGGVGLGALAVLLGLTLGDGGAWWTRVRRSRGHGREYAAALDAVCRAGGRLLALGGGLLVLVTVLALVAGASAGVGAAIVGVTVTTVTALLAAWLLHANRHRLRPLAAWPTHAESAPLPAPKVDDPPPLAVTIDDEVAASGVAAVPPPPVPSRQDGDDDPLPAAPDEGEAGGPPAIEAPASDHDAGAEVDPTAGGEPPDPAADEWLAAAADDPLPALPDPHAVHRHPSAPAQEAALVASNPGSAVENLAGNDAPASATGAPRQRQRVKPSGRPHPRRR